MFNKLINRFSQHVGIDLGTANTIIYVKDKGIVINEPSVVAINNRTEQVLSVGRDAELMIGKTPPYITALKPLENGVISDFEVTEKMIRSFMERIYHEKFSLFLPRPRVVIGTPLDVTEVERKAVEDAVLGAGAREVLLIEKNIAAALGARLPIHEATGSMVVDLGAGTTEIAVVSLGGIVTSKTLKIAGHNLDNDIIQYVRNEFNLLLGQRVAEYAKIKVGCTYDIDEHLEVSIRGRDLVSGLPKELMINNHQIREAISRSISLIVDDIKATLEITPPELVADIYERGIVLTGGASLLRGLDVLIAKETEIPVYVTDDPLTTVVRGTGFILEDLENSKSLIMPSAHDDQIL